MKPSAIARVSIAVLALLVPACSRDAQPPSSTQEPAILLPDREPTLAHELVEEGAVLLDVRTPEEYASRHLDGAVNIPVDELKSRMAEMVRLTGGDKSKPIVVYCQSGGRAARAKTLLTASGYRLVTNLGGIDDWR